MFPSVEVVFMNNQSDFLTGCHVQMNSVSIKMKKIYQVFILFCTNKMTCQIILRDIVSRLFTCLKLKVDITLKQLSSQYNKSDTSSCVGGLFSIDQ